MLQAPVLERMERTSVRWTRVVALAAAVSDAMPYDVRDDELLYEFDIEIAVWTTWANFQQPDMRPVHRRWIAP